MIKEAAIQRISDGKVWTGKRHGDVIKKILEEETDELSVPRSRYTQGFVTDENVFVDRYEAFAIAVKCNQLRGGSSYGLRLLISEDIY